MGITHLQVEHFIGDVLGLGDASPRISWQYRHHPGHGPKVEIEVTRFVLGGEAHVQHAYAGVDDNVLFHWPFDPLAPREHATLRARLTDVQATGPWSDRLEVETGLLVPFLRMADFVGPWTGPVTTVASPWCATNSSWPNVQWQRDSISRP